VETRRHRRGGTHKGPTHRGPPHTEGTPYNKGVTHTRGGATHTGDTQSDIETIIQRVAYTAKLKNSSSIKKKKKKQSKPTQSPNERGCRWGPKVRLPPSVNARHDRAALVMRPCILCICCDSALVRIIRPALPPTPSCGQGLQCFSGGAVARRGWPRTLSEHAAASARLRGRELTALPR